MNSDRSKDPSISVIIAAYNKPEYLRCVLCGYQCQTDKDFEIIVADDGSGPQVAAVIEDFKQNSDLAITHLWHEDQGFRKSVALNRAISQARGDYIIISDDDCLPRYDFVEMHRKFSRPNQYIVGSYNRLPLSTSKKVNCTVIKQKKPFKLSWLMRNGYFPTRGFVRILLSNKVGQILDLRGPLDAGRLPGGNASFHKEDALRVGGFDERMTYGREDREFGTRLHHAGVKAKRLKNSTYVLHLEHSRGYFDEDQFAENERIWQETVSTKSTKAGHLK